MKHVLFVCLIFIILCCCGCQTSIYTLTNNEKMYPATQAANIKVTTHEKIDGEYTEIGYVFAIGGSVEASIEHLKQKAAELGGTSVIKLQTTVIRQFILFVPIDNFYTQGIVVKL